MANLSTQYLADTGVVPALTALAGLSQSVEIGNGHDTWLVLRNSGTSKTVSIVIPGNTPYGEPNPDRSITLPATTGELWIPLRREYMDSTTPGRATVTFSADVTGVTGAVVRVS